MFRHTVRCQGTLAAQEAIVWRTQDRGDSREPCHLSGDNAAHADGLHLPPWFCDCRVSWYAHRVARSSSPYLLLAYLHASRLSRAQDLGRDGPVDPSDHHRLALWTPAQSRLLERTSPRELVGTGPPSHLAAPCQWRAVSLWRRQPCRQTRHQKSRGAKRAHQPASSLVFWPALRAVDGGMGRLSLPRGLSAHSAQAPRRLSQ